METIRLTIPNMKCNHCQVTVSNVVRNAGDSVTKIGSTQAEISIPDGASSTLP